MAAPGMSASAELSACGRYRYALERSWAAELGTAPRIALFVLLNPSTADAAADDPTLRRCVAFARAWGCSTVRIGNLYAFRATDPRELAVAADPVGPDTDAWLVRLAAGADLVVAGWGAHAARDPGRAAEVMALLRAAHAEPASCLGRTQDGHPRHPLYVAGGTVLEPL